MGDFIPQLPRKTKIRKQKQKSILPSPDKGTPWGIAQCFLTDGELVKLKTEIPDWEKMIRRQSCYMKNTGKTCKDHLAIMRSRAAREAQGEERPGGKPSDSRGDNAAEDLFPL